MRETRTPRPKSAYAAALFLILGSTWFSAPEASAQLPPLGSLIVNITSPSSGSTVRGTVPASATVTIIGGLTVRGVQFKIDSVNLGAEDTTEPYSVPWDTSTASNATHTVTAVARDILGASWTDQVTVTVDNAPPTVSINQASGQPDPTRASPINFRVAFSEAVTDFSSGDVSISGTAGGSKTVTVSGGPSTYNVAVAGMTNGTVIATVAAGVAHDAAGNGNTASTSADNTVTFDTVAPAVTINQAAGQPDPTSASPINFTVVFGESVTGFTSGDVTISGTAGGSKTVTLSGGPGAYNVAVAGMTDGTVIASIAAGVALDAAGNTNTASTSTDNTVTFSPPDTMPPTVAITSPASGATVSGTVAVTASATDNVGVARVEFFAGTTSLGTDTAAPWTVNWNTSTVADGTYSLTARAWDTADNTAASAPITVTVSNASASTIATRFENTDLSITYAAGAGFTDWYHGSRSRGWSAGTASFQRAAGGLATFRFRGTSVTWIGFRAFWAGIANVYLDGVLVRELDLYGPGEEVQAPVFTATDLAPDREHTLAIEATGGKNPAAADNAVVVDAFDVGPSVPPAAEGQRFEETSPAPTMSYIANWTQGDTTRPWSGLTAAVSTTTGARATFTFTGTSVSWIGLRGPHTGIARVFLDGAFQAQVDTYSPTEFQARVFSATDLAPARHTLTIEVAGNNAKATSNLIVVDAFDVGSRFEERDSSVVYSGWWVTENVNRAWSGTTANSGPGTAAFSRGPGTSAEFTFTGTSVTWIGYRTNWAGLADVSLDGVFVGRVDLYSPTDQLRVPVFTSDPLPPGSHTLRIDVTGDRNPASGDAMIFVDAFDVGLPSPGVPVRRFSEDDPSLSPTYSPRADNPSSGWVQGSGLPFWSGQRAMFSDMAGAQATFTFTGTSVTWIGDRSQNTGIARVIVDGGAPVEVDTFANVIGDSQMAIFSRSGLPPGTHTLTIEATGLKNAFSGSPRIVVDAIDVQDESAPTP